MKKGIAVVIIILFICMSIPPSSGNMMSSDDTMPPVTTHTLDPPEPNGENGWYVSDVNVTFKATDDMSGVKEIRYEVDGVPGKIIGDNGTFTIDQGDNGDDVLVEYWAVDNAGNKEPRNYFTIDMDQTRPEIDLTYEYGNKPPLEYIFTANATDYPSGMDRVEFYVNDELKETVYGPGPEYIWEFHWNPNITSWRVVGLIRNRNISEKYVKFYAIIVLIFGVGVEGGVSLLFGAVGYDKAGNSAFDEPHFPPFPVNISSGIYLFQNLTLPNNYSGYIGRFFIWAKFGQP